MANYSAIVQGNVLPAVLSFVGSQNQQNFNKLVKAVVPNIISKIEFRSTVNPPFSISGQDLAKSLLEEEYTPQSGVSKFIKPTIIVESPVFNKAVIAPAGLAGDKDFDNNKKKLIYAGIAAGFILLLLGGSVGYAIGKKAKR